MSTVLYQSQKVTPIINIINPLEVKMVDQSITENDLLQQQRNDANKKQQQQQQQVSAIQKNAIINESNQNQNPIEKVTTQKGKRLLRKKKVDGKSRNLLIQMHSIYTALIQMHTNCTDQDMLDHVRDCDEVRRQRGESNRRMSWFGGSHLFKRCGQRFQDEEDSPSLDN